MARQKSGISANTFKISGMKSTHVKPASRIFRREFAKKPYSEKWGTRGAEKRIRAIFRANEEFCLAAEMNGKTIGFVLCSVHPFGERKRAFVEEIVVASEHQGRGIGTALMDALEDKIMKAGAKSVFLIAHKKARAYKFHTASGYRKHADYAVMEKSLV